MNVQQGQTIEGMWHLMGVDEEETSTSSASGGERRKTQRDETKAGRLSVEEEAWLAVGDAWGSTDKDVCTEGF